MFGSFGIDGNRPENRIKMMVKWIRMLNRIARGYTRRLVRLIRQSISTLNQPKQVLHGNQVFTQLFIKEEPIQTLADK